ncbi:MAG: hypothetical protein KatS3mg115_1075 [Candidatus Poribacteria bacterium]|nr:MAG: hypothetical protein KatS3mg115_1075 [Candidatus Poribacteria bacterium]
MRIRLYRLAQSVLMLLVVGAFLACGGEKPPYEITHSGIVVRLQSENEARKPYLRVDVVLQYPAEVQKDKVLAARLEGAEGRAAVRRGLAELPTAEQIERDQNFAADEAKQSVIESLQEQGLPTPTKVIFTDFVIQG